MITPENVSSVKAEMPRLKTGPFPQLYPHLTRQVLHEYKEPELDIEMQILLLKGSVASFLI